MKELRYRPYKSYLVLVVIFWLVALVDLTIMVMVLFFDPLFDPPSWGVAGLFLVPAVLTIGFAYWFFRISKTLVVFNEKGVTVYETHPKGQRAFFEWTEFCCACRMYTFRRKHSTVVLMPKYDMHKAKAALKRSIQTDKVIVDGMVVIALLDGGAEVLSMIQSKRPLKL